MDPRDCRTKKLVCSSFSVEKFTAWVDSEYIIWLTIGPQPTDITTRILFLKDAEKT